MADDRIAPPALAPELADLLTTTERDVLRAIVRDGDIIDGFNARLLNGAHGLPSNLDEGAGDTWLLVRLSPALFDALAAFEADEADLEIEPDLELDHDAEPSLGATNDLNQERAWRAAEVGGTDLEFDGDGVPDADAEPMLGAPEDRNGGRDQTHWARGRGSMGEEAAIEDEGHADTFEDTGLPAGCADDEASLGATVEFDQRLAWAELDCWLPTDGEEDGESRRRIVDNYWTAFHATMDRSLLPVCFPDQFVGKRRP